MTKKKIAEFLRYKLSTCDKWALRALEVIFENQTEDEKDAHITINENNIGFNKVDADLLSSFAKQYQQYGSLSNRQMEILKKRIAKYWKQILEIANKEKLEKIIEKDNQVEKPEEKPVETKPVMVQDDMLKAIEALK